MPAVRAGTTWLTAPADDVLRGRHNEGAAAIDGAGAALKLAPVREAAPRVALRLVVDNTAAAMERELAAGAATVATRAAGTMGGQLLGWVARGATFASGPAGLIALAASELVRPEASYVSPNSPAGRAMQQALPLAASLALQRSERQVTLPAPIRSDTPTAPDTSADRPVATAENPRSSSTIPANKRKSAEESPERPACALEPLVTQNPRRGVNTGYERACEEVIGDLRHLISELEESHPESEGSKFSKQSRQDPNSAPDAEFFDQLELRWSELGAPAPRLAQPPGPMGGPHP